MHRDASRCAEMRPIGCPKETENAAPGQRKTWDHDFLGTSRGSQHPSPVKVLRKQLWGPTRKITILDSCGPGGFLASWLAGLLQACVFWSAWGVLGGLLGFLGFLGGSWSPWLARKLGAEMHRDASRCAEMRPIGSPKETENAAPGPRVSVSQSLRAEG